MEEDGVHTQLWKLEDPQSAEEHVKACRPQLALSLFWKLYQNNWVQHCKHTYIALIKACAQIKDWKQGCAVYAESVKNCWLNNDMLLGGSLVFMYGKFGFLSEARCSFDRLTEHDVVLWTSLIKGYSEHGYIKEALTCFQRMLLENVLPDPPAFVCSLQACGNLQIIGKGQNIHAIFSSTGLIEGEPFVGTSLVDMYAKCGFLAKAQRVFDKLPVRTVVTWTALITAYAEYGHETEALRFFEQMQSDGISPDPVTLVCCLRICGSIRDINTGKDLHAKIAKQTFLSSNLGVGNAVVDMYAKCGFLARAQEVFEELPDRDTVSWNVLITGYADHGQNDEAIKCFEQMKLKGVAPDSGTYISILKAYKQAGATAEELCLEIEKKGLLKKDHFLGSLLVNFYCMCGLNVKARQVFDNLPQKNVVSWNALISGYAEHGHSEEAIACYEEMQIEGVLQDIVTYVCMLKACAAIGAIEKGRELHIDIEKRGLLDEVLIGNTLVDLYGKCGLLEEAHYVFSRIPFRTVVSWTALIAGYAEHEHGERALDKFEQMNLEGVTPDAFTYIHCLRACGNILADKKGEEVHAEIERHELLENNIVLGNVLVDMYAKCGVIVKAQQVFDRLPYRDVISWNVLIAGYAECSEGEEVIKCFERMRFEGFQPDVITLSCILKGCAGIETTSIMRDVHAEVERQGLLETDMFIGSSLVEMYSKCGSLDKAQAVFEKLPVQDVVSWNALMVGYSQIGKSNDVFEVFDRMLGKGVKPDTVTFLVIMRACKQTGLQTEFHTLFEAMGKEYGIPPSLKHYICMVDILSHSGQLDKAVAIINKMPFSPTPLAWHKVLDSCRSSGSVGIGKHIFDYAMRLDHKDPITYILMSRICATIDAEKNIQL